MEDFDAMFLSNDAHKMRYQELEVFIKCLGNPGFLFSKHCNILTNPDDGKEFAIFVKKNLGDVWNYLLYKNHKMNDKNGDWCCGGMGSRWTDIQVGGQDVRLAYYSRKSDPKFYNSVDFLKGDNTLMICMM